MTDIDEFGETLDTVAGRGAVVDAVLVYQLVAARRRGAVLSPCERQVLALMAEERSNTRIARQPWVTEGTVEKHVHSILTELTLPNTDGDHRRVLAVITFVEARQLLAMTVSPAIVPDQGVIRAAG